LTLAGRRRRGKGLNRDSFWNFAFLFIPTAVACLGGCASLPKPDHLATPAGSFSYVTAGTGSPAVVFESGLGDGRETWQPVFAEVATFTTVFAYDRGGYGDSAARSPDRSARQIVEELRALLKAAHIEPPFVLVGHSIGGLYVNLFARTYPDEVAGVVFVDARHEDFSERCKAAAALVCAPPVVMVALAGGGAMQEYKYAPASMQQVRDAGPFPPIPVIVLTGTKKWLEGAAFNRVWLETQKEMSQLSPRGTHVVCDHCGHYVQRDDPRLVIDAIHDVIARATRPPQ
jgi:pimeloyl-ACP methyl ester carboxylesterase